MTFSYRWPRPAVTADCVVFRWAGARLEVLLVKRRNPPFRGLWSIPGGYVEMGEPLERAARRELREETGVAPARLVQLHAFGDPGRDPRGRTVTVTHLALADGRARVRAGDDALEAGWFSAARPPRLAFDHDLCVAVARRRLRLLARLKGASPGGRVDGRVFQKLLRSDIRPEAL